MSERLFTADPAHALLMCCCISASAMAATVAVMDDEASLFTQSHHRAVWREMTPSGAPASRSALPR